MKYFSCSVLIMQFKKPGHTFVKSHTFRIFTGAFVWLVFISLLHLWVNGEKGKRRIIKMGYMPVITNLAAPLLDKASREKGDFKLQAIKFSSFAEMALALRSGDIQVAFIIAPLAIVLRQQGDDVKIIYIGNRHESTLVARKSLGIHNFADLKGKTVAVPMRYSGHNLSILKMLEENSMTGQVKIVEMNPPDMASSLATGSLDAYYVGEPFAAQTLKSGKAVLIKYVEQVWPGFICNLMIVRGAFIKKDPEIVRAIVEGAIRSGLWAKTHIKKAAEIASEYWNQPVDLIEYALVHPQGRVRFDMFMPKESEIQYMADLMVHFGLSKTNDIKGLVDNRFAKNANLEKITDFDSILILRDEKK